MPLINCKISLELTWTKNCVLSNDAGNGGHVSFKIKNTVLYVPVVTLSTKENAYLTKQLKEGFKRSVCWNKYKQEIDTYDPKDTFTKLSLDPSFQGVNRLFALAFNKTTNDDDTDTVNRVKKDSHRKYFLPRVDITDYNISIDGRNFYDQPINNQIRKYDEIRKTATGKGDDYATGCLLDYKYFKENYQLIAIDLSKQKELDADPRAIQQIDFRSILNLNAQICTVLEKSKGTILEFYKGVAKIL